MSKKSKPEIILIAAIGQNYALGKNNAMLWHLPKDFAHFKKTTMGYPMIMGRKTFESLPRVLPGRVHIVVSRNDVKHTSEHVLHAKGIEEAVELATKTSDKIFIIGGGEVYTQSLSLASKIFLTKVDVSIEADTFFPKWDSAQWQLEEETCFPADEQHAYDFCIQTWIRKETTT